MTRMIGMLLAGKKQGDGTRAERADGASLKKGRENGLKVTSIRIQVTLKPEYAKLLERIKEETGSASYSDVLRFALRLYEDYLSEVQAGNTIISKAPDGTLTRIKVV